MPMPMPMPTTITRKIGSNRGKPRLWIEGPALTAQHWKPGKPFVALWQQGKLSYDATLAPLPGLSIRKVAGTAARPIIDTNTDKLTTLLKASVGDTVTITLTPDLITVTKQATA